MAVRDRASTRVHGPMSAARRAVGGWRRASLVLLSGLVGCQWVAGLEGERQEARAGAAAAGSAPNAQAGRAGGTTGVGGNATLLPTASAAGLAGDSPNNAGSSSGEGGAPGGSLGGGGGDAATSMGGADLSGGAGSGDTDNSRQLTTKSCANFTPTGCGDINPCLTIQLDGGKFMMGRNEDATRADYYPTGSPNEVPEHQVAIGPYSLDKYEVTVGRFRRFVDAYDGVPPKAGDGANPRIFGSGWDSDWDVNLPANATELRKGLVAADPTEITSMATWTEVESPGDCRPINFIDWYIAYRFCIWDGGRLPSEAEWEFAAAGGSQERLFPWGRADSAKRAVAACSFSGSLTCTGDDLPRIGSLSPAGDGRFGHVDLAGSVAEFTRDAYSTAFYALPQGTGTDVVNLAFYSKDSFIATRGGDAVSPRDFLRNAARDSLQVSTLDATHGIRCARDP